MERILVIQTSFIGDVILATAVVEELAAAFPNARIDFLLRKGNESLLSNNPHVNAVLIWNKRQQKYLHLLRLMRRIRSEKYDLVINLQRFLSTGFLTAFAGTEYSVGFDKNPLSIFYIINYDILL